MAVVLLGAANREITKRISKAHPGFVIRYVWPGPAERVSISNPEIENGQPFLPGLTLAYAAVKLLA